MHLIHRKTCRVCGSAALTPVIDLGDPTSPIDVVILPDQAALIVAGQPFYVNILSTDFAAGEIP